MDLLQAFVLGVVEGVTEFLPISSTGHLIIAGRVLGLAQSNSQTAFDIIIQLGAIFAVIANYRDKFTPAYWDLWRKIFVAFIPIGLVGFVFESTIESLFSVHVVATTFILGGIVFLVLEHFYKPGQSHHVTRIEGVTWRHAIWVGLAQVCALVPGTSRSGSTIVGGLLVGLDRKTAAEFSFLLALPVMVATTGYAVFKHHSEFAGTSFAPLAVGFITAFFVAFLAVRWLIYFLSRYTFRLFGVYRIVLGVILLIWFH